jgi:hypothetical protein
VGKMGVFRVYNSGKKIASAFLPYREVTGLIFLSRHNLAAKNST